MSGTKPESWQKFMEQTDWGLFLQQKELLITLTIETPERLTRAEQDLIEGLLNFLDGIGDVAADRYHLFQYPRSFEEDDPNDFIPQPPYL